MTNKNSDIESKALALFEQALDQPQKTRRDFIKRATVGNEALNARVLTLLKLDSQNSTKILTGHAVFDGEEQDLSNTNIGSYRITELIGKGGMGAVYKAERRTGDFKHDVAIKFIRPGVLSESLVDPLINRFTRERQTLADFSHPNIALLFDGGTTADGSPYIIMEYIDGLPIIDWSIQNQLNIKARLKLFKSACEAVSYAHQNLIVHRDITPNNVLVTQNGIVKLIDFGIAKPNRDDALIKDSSHSLDRLNITSGFAAPERSKGGTASTLSDIYSLGKLLEALLAKMTKPSDLEAIIAKATQVDPNNRYISVDAMIADIDRYRTGRVVQAYKAGAYYPVRKFISRNKLTVSLATFALSGLIGGLIITANLYHQAKFARKAAESRFTEARELNREILFDIYPELSKITGAFDVRQNLANVLRDFTADLANDPFASDEILLDVGISKTELADIYGGIGIPNLGDADEAVRLLEEAVDVLSTLVSRSPDNGEAFEKMATAKRFLTVQYNPTSEENRLRSKTLNDELLRETRDGANRDWPEARAIRRIFWQARTDKLRLLLIDGKVDEAIEKVTKWRAELTPAVQDSIDRGARMAAFFAAREGELQKKAGNIEKALPALEDALSFYASQSANDPTNYHLNYTSIILRAELASSYLKTGQIIKAQTKSINALAGVRKLVEADPSNKGAKEQLVQTLTSMGEIERVKGELETSIETLQEAISISRGLLDTHADNEKATDILLWAEAGLIKSYKTNNQIEAACTHWKIVNTLMKRAKENGSLRPFTATRLPTTIEEYVNFYTCPAIK